MLQAFYNLTDSHSKIGYIAHIAGACPGLLHRAIQERIRSAMVK